MNTETLDPGVSFTETGTLPCEDFVTPAFVRLKNILVPLDFSDTSLKALRYAVFLANQFGAKITLLHCLRPALVFSDYPYPGPMGQDVFEAVENQLRDIRFRDIPPGVPVDIVVRQCFVFDGIPEVARETHADLVITTPGDRAGLKRLFRRSTAKTITRRAPCPVLVVHDLGYAFV